MNRTPPPIVFFGASGHASALRTLMRRNVTLEPLFEIVAYIDDYRGDRGDTLDGRPIITFERWRAGYAAIPVFVSVGDPEARRVVAARLREAGAAFPAIYDASDIGDVAVGEGGFVTAGLRFDDGARVGAFSHVFPFASFSGATEIGDYVTVGARTQTTGTVYVGEGCYLGTACRIDGTVEPVRIGRGVRIAAGTVVTRSLGDGVRAYGDPIRVIDGMHIIH